VQIKVAIILLLREEWPQGKDKLNTYIRDFNVPIYLQKIVENTSLVGRNRRYTRLFTCTSKIKRIGWM